MDQAFTSREKLAQAAIDLVRSKGYAATRVEDICAAAGVTKGSFFHHFASKDEAALAAAERWRDHVRVFFGEAPYQAHADPVDRLLAYVDFRRDILMRPLAACACFAGTMVQEIHESHPALRDACAVAIDEHVAEVEAIVAAALAARGLEPDWSAQSLSQHIHAVVQGALVLAKASQDLAPAQASFDHLRRYIEQIFGRGPSAKGAT